MPAPSDLPTHPQAPSLGFLRSDADDPPVTVIREIHVKPGREARFELLMGELVAHAVQQAGHLGSTVLRPHGSGSGGAYRFVYKFDRRSNLEAWHASPRRAQLFAPVADLILHDRFEVYPGLETWFDLPPHAVPPKWKTTLMSWAAIYLLVVAISYVMQALELTLPIPVAALVLTAIVVPLVAYVVGPLMGRALHGWLHAGTSR